MIEESKRRAAENFGSQLSEKYEDKRLYWKEDKDERKRGVNVSKEVQDADGRI